MLDSFIDLAALRNWQTYIMCGKQKKFQAQLFYRAPRAKTVRHTQHTNIELNMGTKRNRNYQHHSNICVQ